MRFYLFVSMFCVLRREKHPGGCFESRKSYKVEENESWSVGDTMATVSEYNTAGLMRDLPDLTRGRAYHACTSFLSSAKERVILVFR